MASDIVALLIPILGVIGLFTSITLGIYFKTRAKESISRNISGDAVGEWFRYEAEARAQRSRNALFRTVGFLIGAGIGVAIGCAVISHPDFAAHTHFDVYALATFTILALGLVCGGLCMIGSYFVQRAVERKR